MATNSNWTVIMDDKMMMNQNIKNAEGFGTSYIIDDDSFWNQEKFSNIWAIQHGTSNSSDEVEYKDGTPHSSWEDANLGNFSDFITRWDTSHLARLQHEWDHNNVEGESESDKISRLSARPTSYSSL